MGTLTGGTQSASGRGDQEDEGQEHHPQLGQVQDERFIRRVSWVLHIPQKSGGVATARAGTTGLQPASKKQLQSILGTLGFYAKFVKNYSTRVEPLRRQLRQDAPEFAWKQLRSASTAAKEGGADGVMDIQAIVDAVLAQLHTESEPAVTEVKAEAVDSSSEQRQLWMAELRRMLESGRYGVREKEDVRSLLIIGEGAGPPPDQEDWYWGRVRLFLIVAQRGWAAAVSDARATWTGSIFSLSPVLIRSVKVMGA